MFRGNVDNNTPYANSFTPPIKAQYIRLYPQVCRRHCTLRMELLGCELSGETDDLFLSILSKQIKAHNNMQSATNDSASTLIALHFCLKSLGKIIEKACLFFVCFALLCLFAFGPHPMTLRNYFRLWTQKLLLTSSGNHMRWNLGQQLATCKVNSY